MMLNAQERRAKLEELLARVKRNRGYLEEERESAAASGPDAENEELPLPSEPSPIEIDAINATTADILGARQAPQPIDAPEEESFEKAEEESFEEVEEPAAVEEEESFEEPEASAPGEEPSSLEKTLFEGTEELADEKPEPGIDDKLMDLDEPSYEVTEDLEAEPEETAEVLEIEEEEEEDVYVPDVTDEILEDEPEIQAEAAEPEVAEPEVAEPEAFEPEVRSFKAEPAATGDVAVLKGEITREWTLNAVLDRAWKLGK